MGIIGVLYFWRLIILDFVYIYLCIRLLWYFVVNNFFICFGWFICRNAPDFPKFLGVAMETFLLLCDDAESDVRIVADECLNRTIKVIMG